MQNFVTNSSQETQKLAATLAKNFKDGGVIALSGPLGAGKTTFTQGFTQGLGIKEKVLSPTFILMRQYKIPNKTEGLFFHLDLYRLENIKDIKELGISEIFSQSKNIILIEWAEKIMEFLPKKTVWIYFKPISEDKREISIKN